jgi:hypothetical protein
MPFRSVSTCLRVIATTCKAVKDFANMSRHPCSSRTPSPRWPQTPPVRARANPGSGLCLLQPVALLGNVLNIFHFGHNDPDHIHKVLTGTVVARLQGLGSQLAARHRLGALLQDLRNYLAQGHLLRGLLLAAPCTTVYGWCSCRWWVGQARSQAGRLPPGEYPSASTPEPVPRASWGSRCCCS